MLTRTSSLGPILSKPVCDKDSKEVFDSYSFILGGKSEFTIKNLRSDREFKYKVTRCKRDKTLYFVRVKDRDAWVYAGCLRLGEDDSPHYYQGNKGLLDSNSPAIRGIMYTLKAGHNPLQRPMILLHHGKCACCGKKLDDDESVMRGFGPICWSKLDSEYRNNIVRKMRGVSYA